MVKFTNTTTHGRMETYHGQVDNYCFDLRFVNGSIDVVIVDSLGKEQANQENFGVLKEKVKQAFIKNEK